MLHVIKEEPVEYELILPPDESESEKETEFQSNQEEAIKIEETNRRFHCDKCEKSYKCVGTLNQHKKIHEALRFQCNTCEFKTCYKQCINRHMLKHEVKLEASIRRQKSFDFGNFYFSRQILSIEVHVLQFQADNVRYVISPPKALQACNDTREMSMLFKDFSVSFVNINARPIRH